jgi:hypothetical protein
MKVMARKLLHGIEMQIEMQMKMVEGNERFMYHPPPW